MSDFLGHLVERALGTTAPLRPRPVSRFELPSPVAPPEADAPWLGAPAPPKPEEPAATPSSPAPLDAPMPPLRAPRAAGPDRPDTAAPVERARRAPSSGSERTGRIPEMPPAEPLSRRAPTVPTPTAVRASTPPTVPDATSPVPPGARRARSAGRDEPPPRADRAVRPDRIVDREVVREVSRPAMADIPPRPPERPIAVTPLALPQGNREPVRPIVPPAVAPRRRDDTRPGDAAPDVHVTIGRIEIRATVPAPAGTPARQSPVVMSLDEYLRQRQQGGAE